MTPLTLDVESVSVAYSNGHRALHEATFHLKGGTICALVGVNGSGKSTLFKSIMGFIRPDRGDRTTDIQNIAAILVPEVTESENSIWQATAQQVIAGAIGPSHAFVHVTELDCPVTIFGMPVRPDDLIHADRHGAVVIPAEHIERMAWAIDVVMRKEVPILTAARAPGFNIEKLKAAWAEADKIN